MKKKYKTLDEYLDDRDMIKLDKYLDKLDKIKEEIAEETKDMDAKQLTAYFAQSRRDLEKKTGRKIRTRKPNLQRRTASR